MIQPARRCSPWSSLFACSSCRVHFAPSTFCLDELEPRTVLGAGNDAAQPPRCPLGAQPLHGPPPPLTRVPGYLDSSQPGQAQQPRDGLGAPLRLGFRAGSWPERGPSGRASASPALPCGPLALIASPSGALCSSRRPPRRGRARTVLELWVASPRWPARQGTRRRHLAASFSLPLFLILGGTPVPTLLLRSDSMRNLVACQSADALPGPPLRPLPPLSLLLRVPAPLAHAAAVRRCALWVMPAWNGMGES